MCLHSLGCAGGVGTIQHNGLTSEGVYSLPRNDVSVVFTNQNIASEVKAATKTLGEEAKKKEAAATEAVNRAEKVLAAIKPDAKPEERKKFEKDLEGK